MASHESYYTSTATPPPPPPKPSSHDPSRTGTPTVPPIPTHPSQGQSQSQDQPQTAPGLAQIPVSSSRAPTPGSGPAPPPPPHPQSPFDPNNARPQRPQSQSFQQGAVATSHQQQAVAVSPPALDSGWLPQGLDGYTTAELQPLLHNPDLLDAFARQHPSYSASLEPLQSAVAANTALAQHVTQLETQVKQLRDQTGQLLLNHTSLQTQWRRKQSEMDDALSSWGPRAMYSRLVSSINEQEAVLRAVHESFVEGGGESHEFYGSTNGKATEKEVTEWVKRIREGTSVLEKRREMRQRWDEGRVGGWR